jgi:hypothetical protein
MRRLAGKVHENGPGWFCYRGASLAVIAVNPSRISSLEGRTARITSRPSLRKTKVGHNLT